MYHFLPRRLITTLQTVIVLVLGFLMVAPAQGIDHIVAQSITPIQISSGGPLGVYYPTATAMCKFLNRSVRDLGITCAVRPSRGSVENLNRLRQGDVDFALVQSDVIQSAWNGSEYLNDITPYEGLRVVLDLYTETYTVVVRANTTIRIFADLKGKRINVGPPGTGHYTVTKSITKALQWADVYTKTFMDFDSSDQMAALCDNKIDALVTIIGHPSSMFSDDNKLCDVRIIGFSKASIARIMSDQNYMVETVIPKGLYSTALNDISTLGVNAHLVADIRTPDSIVFEMVKSISENYRHLQLLIPVFQDIPFHQTKTEGRPAPEHPGATRFFDSAN